MANLASGLRIAGSLGDRASEADLLSQMAVASANRLRLADALEYGTRAVSAARASGDEQALAAGLDGLKIAYLNVGDLGGLAGVLVELRPLLRRLGDPYRLQWAEFESAYLSIAPGDLDKAAEAMRAGLEVNRRGGYPHFAAYYTAHLGWLARLRGDDEEAMTLGRRAVDIAEQHEQRLVAGHGVRHARWHAAAGRRPGRGDRDCSNAALPPRSRPARRPTCCTAPPGWPPPPARLPCWPTPTGCLGRPTSRRAARGCSARRRISPWRRPGWIASEPERARAVLAPLLALAERVPWTPALAAALAADARALIRLGERERARAQLLRAERLATAHGLAHVREEARQAMRYLGGLTAARPGTRRPAPRRLSPPAGS